MGDKKIGVKVGFAGILKKNNILNFTEARNKILTLNVYEKNLSIIQYDATIM